MAKPKIMVCDQMAEGPLNALKELFDVDENIGQTPEGLAETIGPYEAIIVRSATKVREPAIDAAVEAGNLKVIVRGGVGIDNIDHEYARSKGIEVMNTPAASSISVSELALGMMLACARHIGMGTHSMKNGEWLKKKLKGVELYGKTLGIIGYGRIGRLVADKALALGMNVLAYDPYVKEASQGVDLTDLENLLRRSDFISLHTPHTPDTHYIINAEALAKMKDGVCIVNCGRGGTLDETALAEAIKSGKVAGAALDVYEDEKEERGKRFMDLPQVIGSPHVGAGTAEAKARVGEEVAQIAIEVANR